MKRDAELLLPPPELGRSELGYKQRGYMLGVADVLAGPACWRKPRAPHLASHPAFDVTRIRFLEVVHMPQLQDTTDLQFQELA